MSIIFITNRQKVTQSGWSSKPIVKSTANTSLSKSMLAVKWLTRFKLRSIETVGGCGLSASNQVMLTCGGFTMNDHKFQPTPMPEDPAIQPPAPEEIKLLFSSRPNTDWPNWRPSAPYIACMSSHVNPCQPRPSQLPLAEGRATATLHTTSGVIGW